ncbi:MAG: hypothetical protein GY936_10730 [Ignavibacteriae bacterium]|nr:hypothetical protein [Ignavibacteriota bacterium]
MKHFKLAFTISLLSLAFLTQGCFTLNQVGTPTDYGIEITNKDNETSTHHFIQYTLVNHYLWGLVSPEDAGVEKIIANEIHKYKGSRAVNIKIRYQQTFVNGLLGGLTAGIYNPFTLMVEGDVVK